MHLGAGLGVLLSIAATVLFGLVAFSAPINKNIWLLAVHAGELTLHCGTLGMCTRKHCTSTRLGYDLNSIGPTYGTPQGADHWIKGITYALVTFPVAFGLSVIAVLLCFIGIFTGIGVHSLAVFVASLGSLVGCVGFVLLLVLWLSARRALDVTPGIGLWLALAGFVVLFVASWVIGCGACVTGTRQRSDRKRRSNYGKLFAGPQRQPIDEEGIGLERYPADNYALQPSEATSPRFVSYSGNKADTSASMGSAENLALPSASYSADPYTRDRYTDSFDRDREPWGTDYAGPQETSLYAPNARRNRRAEGAYVDVPTEPEGAYDQAGPSYQPETESAWHSEQFHDAPSAPPSRAGLAGVGTHSVVPSGRGVDPGWSSGYEQAPETQAQSSYAVPASQLVPHVFPQDSSTAALLPEYQDAAPNAPSGYPVEKQRGP